MMRARHRLAIRLVIALAAIGLFWLGDQWGNQWQQRRAMPPAIAGVRLAAPQPLPPLRDMDGETLDWRGHWSLLALAPTSATESLAMRRLIEVANRLAERDRPPARPRFLLASAAPSVLVAREFASLLPNAHVLIIDAGQSDALGAMLGLNAASNVAQDAPPLLLIDPDGWPVALFSGAQTAASIANDLRLLLGQPAVRR